MHRFSGRKSRTLGGFHGWSEKLGKKSPKYFSSFAKKLLKEEHTREDFIRAVSEINKLHPGSSIKKFINTYREVTK